MRLFSLRRISVEIAAPRALVFEMAAALNGSLPGSPPHTAELVERDGNTLLVRYRTPTLLSELVMVERVQLYPPERIEYAVIEGPIDQVRESLAFDALGPQQTQVTYSGMVGSRRPLLGDLTARFIAVPAYDRFMRRQLRALQQGAEAQALRSRRFRRPETA
jgi:hypothetical protein